MHRYFDVFRYFILCCVNSTCGTLVHGYGLKSPCTEERENSCCFRGWWPDMKWGLLLTDIPYSDFDSGTSQQYFGVNFRWHYGPVYFHVLFVLIVLPYVFQTGNLTQQNRWIPIFIPHSTSNSLLSYPPEADSESEAQAVFKWCFSGLVVPTCCHTYAYMLPPLHQKKEKIGTFKSSIFWGFHLKSIFVSRCWGKCWIDWVPRSFECKVIFVCQQMFFHDFLFFLIEELLWPYCWWKKSCTTWRIETLYRK